MLRDHNTKDTLFSLGEKDDDDGGERALIINCHLLAGKCEDPTNYIKTLTNKIKNQPWNAAILLKDSLELPLEGHTRLAYLYTTDPQETWDLQSEEAGWYQHHCKTVLSDIT
jgi:hypothetical protein